VRVTVSAAQVVCCQRLLLLLLLLRVSNATKWGLGQTPSTWQGARQSSRLGGGLEAAL
jgi:hypothetical protein